jgi:phosphate transport system protein
MMLEDEIAGLEEKTLAMCDYAVNNLKRAFDCYLHYDPKTVYAPIDDDTVDHYEREVEEKCLDIMLRERPYAGDMRQVSGILKMVEDLERLGDHAEDVMEFALKLGTTPRVNLPEIPEMIDLAMSMAEDAILSFIRKDTSLAEEVEKRDDIEDALYDETIDTLIALDEKHLASASFIVYTTLIVKYIERIADHSVNVAEWVVYMIKGYHKDKQIF